ncbi:hypothetical protein RT53_00650, partial [Escherichia coli]
MWWLSRDVSLAAGNHVDVLAATSTDTSWRFKETKKSGLMGTGGNRGDIVIAGSQLKAGGNTSLDAANDILLSGAANTQKTTGR